MPDSMEDLNRTLDQIRNSPTPATPDRRPYRFGDITRMVVRWLGPHARAVGGKLDWLKVGKALVAAWIAGQTVNFGVVGAALLSSINDPEWAAAIPTLVTAIVTVVELGRRLPHDGKDAAPTPEKPDDHP